MKDSDLMTWGKYKGEKLGNVPASYLLWFFEQPWAKEHKELFAYVESGFKHLVKEAEAKYYDGTD